MDSHVERERLKAQYPKSKSWADKVNKMSESQVSAILIRLKSEGKLK